MVKDTTLANSDSVPMEVISALLVKNSFINTIKPQEGHFKKYNTTSPNRGPKKPSIIPNLKLSAFNVIAIVMKVVLLFYNPLNQTVPAPHLHSYYLTPKHPYHCLYQNLQTHR